MQRARLPSGRTTRTPGRGPRDRAPETAVLALQRAAGNAATTRLIGGVRQSIARFGEPEHKGIGDAARNMRFRLPGSKLFKDLELTFGDFVALGDWFENIDDIRKIMRGEPLEGEEDVGHRQARQVRQLPEHHRPALLRRAGEDPAEEPDRGQEGGGARHGHALLQGRQGRGRGALRRLKTRNIKHFPNPREGDVNLSTAEKATRMKAASRSARSPSTARSTSTRSAWR